jgi:hypothetical protein
MLLTDFPVYIRKSMQIWIGLTRWSLCIILSKQSAFEEFHGSEKSRLS